MQALFIIRTLNRIICLPLFNIYNWFISQNPDFLLICNKQYVAAIGSFRKIQIFFFHFAKSRYFFFISQNPDFINVAENVDFAKSRFFLFRRIQIFFISQNPYFAISQNPVSHYCSINLNCCISGQEYLILTIKENCQMDNYGKFGKNCSYKVMGFKLSKLCSGVGNLFRFLDPAARVLH